MVHPLKLLHHPRLWPLRTQARVLVCLLIAVMALVVGELWARRSLAQAQADAGQRLLQSAQHLADRLSQEMATRARDVILLAQLNVLRESPNPGVARVALEKLRDTLPAYAWIGMTDSAGTVVAATDDVLVGQSIAARPVFKHGSLGLWTGDVHEAVMLAQLAPRTHGEPAKFVDVSAPVYRSDGSLRGVIALHLSWQWADELRATLLPRGTLGDVQVMVFSAQGDLLLGPAGAGVPPRLSTERLHALEERWAIEPWSDGVTAMTSAAISPPSGGFQGFGWRVVARDPTPDAPASLADARLAVLAWTAGIAALGALVAWWLIGLIIAPVDDLALALAPRMKPQRRDGVRPRRRNDVQQIAAAVADLQNTLRHRDEAVQVLEHLAHRDPLTGLWNRNYLNVLNDQLSGAVAREGMEFCVLCLDLDGFKPVNDRYGHEAGDEVLVQVAKRLGKIARDEDFVFRLGGDEFMLLLPCPAGEGIALSRQVAQRVVTDLQRPMHYRTISNLHIGCSLGCGVWPQDGDTLANVMTHADEALYAAKRAGRGQFRQYVAELA